MAAPRVLAVALAALAGATPSASLAATAPPLPVVDQYIEQLPTAEGPVAPNTDENRPLPTTVVQQVEQQGGADAGPLTEISTSSRFGAPQRRPAPIAPSTDAPDGEEPATEAIEATDAPTVPRDPRLVVLLLALGASLVAAGGYELLRRRR